MAITPEMKKAMTQKTVFSAIADLLSEAPDQTLTVAGVEIPYPDVATYMQERVAAVANKNKGGTKADPVKEGIKAQVLAHLRAHPATQYTISGLLKDPDLNLPEDVSQNRLTALVSQMVNKDNPTDPACPIVREVVKRVAYFRANPDYQAPEVEAEGGEE